jgi:hypothetical protein
MDKVPAHKRVKMLEPDDKRGVFSVGSSTYHFIVK